VIFMGSGPFRFGVRNRAFVIALLVALIFVVGVIYKWVDEQGKVHYSDKPPPGRESEVVTTSPGPTAEQQARAQRLLQAAREACGDHQRG
jgi:hypothetical protein